MAEEEKVKKDKAAKPIKAKEDKEKKVSKKTPDKKESQSKPKVRDENFKYIVRLNNTDIDGARSVMYGLSEIDGIGLRIAQTIIRALKISPSVKIGTLDDNVINQIAKMLTAESFSSNFPSWMLNRRFDPENGDSYQLIGQEVRIKRQDDINMMKMIKCYKGVRHERGYKVRGQRTKSNGRTGMAAGVTKKVAMAAAAAATAAPAEAKKGEPAKGETAKAPSATAAKKEAEKKK